MDYEKQSDLEINTAVAEALGKFNDPDYKKIGSKNEILYKSYAELENFPDSGIVYKFDPCNNPSDAWPVIMSNHISIIHIRILGTELYRYSASIGADFMTVCMTPQGDDNGVLTFTDDYNYIDENNPLRAAMIVFLKMQEQNHE